MIALIKLIKRKRKSISSAKRPNLLAKSLLTLSIVGILSLIFPINQPVAKAWTGDLPECPTGESFDFPYLDRIKAFGNVDPYDTSTVMLVYSFDANPPATNANITISFFDYAIMRQTGTTRSLSYGRPYYYYNVTTNPANSAYKQNVLEGYDSGTTELSTSSLACLTTVRNASYVPTYTGKIYSTVPPTQKSGCATTDIACKIAEVTNKIGNTFSDAVNAGGNLIYSFFVPDFEQIQEKNEELYAEFNEQMGFMTWGIDLIVDLTAAFNDNTDTWCDYDSCALTFGNIFGQPYTLDFLTLKDVSPTLFELVLIVIRGGVIFAVAYFIVLKYKKIISR